MNDTNAVFGNDGVRIALIGTLAILALFLFVKTASVAANIGRPDNAATDTITVSASGDVNMAPDVARITFTVQNSASTVAAAQEKTTTQANAAIAYAKEQDLAAKDIRTTSYNVYPEYDYSRPCPAGSLCPEYYPGSPKITGYQVSQTIELTIRDLDKAGTVLGGLGSLGVQNISGPSLTLDDPTAGYNAARATAIANAKAQAEVLAAQLGVKLGRVVSFNESSGGYYGKAYTLEAYGRGGDAASAPVPEIPTGENTYTANVSVTYEIR